MLDKLKSTLVGNKQTHQQKVTKIQIQSVNLLSNEQLKASKKLLQKIKDDLQFIDEITRNNRAQIIEFIKQQGEKKPQKEEDDEQFTLADDVLEVKDALKVITQYVGKLQALQGELKNKVEKYNASGGSSPQTEAKLAKCEEELRRIKENQRLEKEIHQTLKQQCVLYTEETRKLQDKVAKLQKDLQDKAQIINNLAEQKQLLLDMKNSANPQLQGLKVQAQQFEKRLAIEKSRYQQKQKESETLRKKLEEERANLQAMADELKEKQLKNKKLVQKYEKSKQKIKQYKQEKTEFIKTLQNEMQALKDQLQKQKGEQQLLSKKVIQKQAELNELNSKYDHTLATNLKSFNLQEQNKALSQSLKQKQSQLAVLNQKVQDLSDQNIKLQEKRQSLLAALEKPVKHEVRTLQKIHKAMEGLYKDYIVDVFDKGDTVQFEKKISTIMTNILQLKEDLLM